MINTSPFPNRMVHTTYFYRFNRPRFSNWHCRDLLLNGNRSFSFGSNLLGLGLCFRFGSFLHPHFSDFFFLDLNNAINTFKNSYQTQNVNCDVHKDFGFSLYDMFLIQKSALYVKSIGYLFC